MSVGGIGTPLPPATPPAPTAPSGRAAAFVAEGVSAEASPTDYDYIGLIGRPLVDADGGDAPSSARRAADGATGGDRPDEDGPPSELAGQEPRAGLPASGPCADKRRATDELCALAARIRSQASVAAESLRDAQLAYDAHLAAADDAASVADPRAQRAAKDAAQQAFRSDRSVAGSRDSVEAAARTWLQEINRINQAARDASARVTRERTAAAALVTTIERLSLEADGTRVQAEAAQETCLNARQELADCEEAVAEERRVARLPAATSAAAEPAAMPAPAAAGQRPPGAEVAAVGGRAGLAAMGLGADPEPEIDESGALAAAAARGDGQPAILQLLAGDRAALERLTSQLASHDPAEQHRWQVQLSDLVDAIVARAIEACAFDFPEDHPFWGPFTVGQDRDIALALSSLGFRFDGLGGFVDDRVPNQRDLSMAVGYAGLDPMRIRHWPKDAELDELYRDVTVAADEYLAGAAGGLTLGELVTLLGRRADPLTELWNAWGRVRPLLLEPI
jgi:hypothetical protein